MEKQALDSLDAKTIRSHPKGMPTLRAKSLSGKQNKVEWSLQSSQCFSPYRLDLPKAFVDAGSLPEEDDNNERVEKGMGHQKRYHTIREEKKKKNAQRNER